MRRQHESGPTPRHHHQPPPLRRGAQYTAPLWNSAERVSQCFRVKYMRKLRGAPSRSSVRFSEAAFSCQERCGFKGRHWVVPRTGLGHGRGFGAWLGAVPGRTDRPRPASVFGWFARSEAPGRFVDLVLTHCIPSPFLSPFTLLFALLPSRPLSPTALPPSHTPTLSPSLFRLLLLARSLARSLSYSLSLSESVFLPLLLPASLPPSLSPFSFSFNHSLSPAAL